MGPDARGDVPGVTGSTSVLLVSGSLRGASTNSAALRTIAADPPPGVAARAYDGLGGLPHFNPDDDREDGTVDAAVRALRAAVHDADALLLCTPEYAGALPGSFKNLLEWLVGDADERSVSGKPVAWINVAPAAAPTGSADAHESLRKVLGYVGAAIVEDACVRVPVDRRALDDRGLIADERVREGLRAAVAALAEAARAGA